MNSEGENLVENLGSDLEFRISDLENSGSALGNILNSVENLGSDLEFRISDLENSGSALGNILNSDFKV